MIFNPQIEGSVSIGSAGPQFLEAFGERVRKGLLTGQPHPRSRYLVVDAEAGRVAVTAADWWTALNVGLNEIELRLPGDGSARYRVRYWRWAFYVLALSGTLGLIGLTMLLGLDVRGYITRHPESMMPGLSVDQNLMLAWVMVLFWGFVWPWLLVALHKRPLRGLLERIIAEVDGGIPRSAAGGWSRRESVS